MSASSSSSQQNSGAAANKLAAGSTFGRYRIEKPLGEGAMGAVYLARDTRLNDRPVALKVPKFAGADREMELQRFHREAGIAATLSHPNLCPVFDVGELDGVHYLAMGFIEGKPLNEVLGGKPIAEKQAALLVRKIAQAMQAAHDKGVVHRDLKPANIMLDHRKEPVVMDFGLAKQQGGVNDAQLTQSGMILGTPAYMSPEQVNGDINRIGPASDVYSLGVILYELLTGARPFQGPITAVLGQILSKDPPPPQQHRPNLDSRLQAIVQKAMAKKIEERYPDMTAFAAALADYLKQSSVGSSVTTAKEETVKAAAELSFGSVAALVDAARQCLNAYDYAEALRLFETIPAKFRTPEIEALRRQAQTRHEEVEALQLEIEPACAAKKYKSLTPKLERLLQLKPGHARAKKLLERLNSYGGKPAKLWFNDAGELLAAPAADGLLSGMGLKYAAMIGVAILAFGLGSSLIYPYLRAPKSNDAPPAPELATAPDVSPTETLPVSTPAEPSVSLAELLTSPDYEWSAPESVGPGVNTRLGDNLAGISDDERTIYIADGELYFCRRESPAAPFTQPRQSTGLELQHFDPAVSADGLIAVLSRWQEGRPDELWITTRTNERDAFGEPVSLGPEVNGDGPTKHPILSADGLTLLACSTRSGSQFGDAWMSTRSSRDEPFGRAERLPAPVNTPFWDMPFHISNDRTVVIAADQQRVAEEEIRSFKLFFRQSPDDAFGPGQPIDLPLGDARGDPIAAGYRLSADGRRLYFQSLRINTANNTDIYVCRRVPKAAASEAQETSASDAELDAMEEDDEDSTAEADPPADVAPSVVLTSPEWKWSKIKRLGPNFNTEAREYSVSIPKKERMVFFLRDNTPMIGVRRSPRSQLTVHAARGPLGDLKQDVYAMSVTADGLTAVLCLRPESERRSGPPVAGSVWISERPGMGRSFGPPVKLPDTVNASPAMRTPWISHDGLILLVSRPGPDSVGGADLYQHTRKSRQENFGPAMHLGNVANTPDLDLGGTLSPDGLVLFRTTRRGNPDEPRNSETVMCTRSDVNQPFDKLLPLDPELAKYKPVGICCSPSGTRIHFHALHDGDKPSIDLFLAERTRR